MGNEWDIHMFMKLNGITNMTKPLHYASHVVIALINIYKCCFFTVADGSNDVLFFNFHPKHIDKRPALCFCDTCDNVKKIYILQNNDTHMKQ
ncbi:hypothetical protein MAR_003959, partial [Mya arenaria]